MSAGLTLAGLRIARGARPLVALDLTIRPGEVLTVMGPSGSGKSTLLSVLIGAPPPGLQVAGRVLLDGRDLGGLPVEARGIGILFQDDLLFPHLSVGGNLGFALPPGVRPRAVRQARIAAALAGFGLEGFAARDPATLSGGERTRVALLRALIAEPRALLLDEPFARLDAGLRAVLRAEVLGLVRARGLPVILVTHDAEDAAAAGGRVLSPLGLPDPRFSGAIGAN